MSPNDSPPAAGLALPSDEVRATLQGLPFPGRLLEEIFLHAPVGLQIYARDGRCVLVNPMHTQIFGAVPPPDYNVFEDTILVERGVAGLVRRAFDGEHIVVPPIWYDARELRNVRIEGPGRRLAVGAELVPLRAEGSGEVNHVLFVFHDVTDSQRGREQAEAARAVADAAAARSAFLAEAGRLLSSSLDYEDTLQRVARMTTPTLADFCVVDLVDGQGEVRRVAAWHAQPEAQPVVEELRRRFPPQLDSPQPAMRAIRTGQTELLTEVDPAVVASHTTSTEHFELMMRLGVHSHLAVPLAIGKRILGAISLGYTGERRYVEADVGLAEALANHAAVAIENARLYRQAELARAEAEAANRTKDEFLAVLGHELRNPLAPMVTALELTRRREGPSPERDIIERQVRHLRRLVDDLLDVSRITRGKLELHRRVFELSEAVAHGAELARPLIEQRGHTLAIDCPSGLPLHGDTERIGQVVSNLLSNAARYTPDGGRIQLRAWRNGDAIVLRVRDNGIGLDAELLPRIFEPFTQGKQTLERSGGGLGLGLAIVRSLVERHGGSTSARSDGPGRGSEFEVLLPAYLDAASSAPLAPGSANSPSASSPSSGSRVLVVDDNQDAADLLAETLTLYGYDARAAYHPEQALVLARELRPDAGILDIGLPDMDGHELARRLLSDTALGRMRLVALTGYGQASDRALAQKAGFQAHLTKPAAIEEVLKVLEKVLRE